MALNETHFSDMMPKNFVAFREKYMGLIKSNSVNVDMLYVQFTNNPEQMDRNPFPNPDHADPVGVYAYPLAYVLSHPADIWYGGAAQYLRVIKNKARNVLILPQDIPTEQEAIRTLGHMGMTTAQAEQSYRLAKKHYKHRIRTPAQAFMTAMQVDLLSPPTGSRESWGKTVTEHRIRTGLEQTQMLRKAGYDAVEDTARRHTQATINAREPEQIIFLHRGAFDIVEVINLRSPQIKQHALPPMTTVDPSAQVTERPFAQALAQMMGGDKLLSGNPERSSLMGWSYYWTKKGRRIEIYFADTQKRDHLGWGEKPHRANKLTTGHELEIRIQTELGELWGTYDSKIKFKDIIRDLSMDWAELIKSPKSTDWEPENRQVYLDKVQQKRMAQAQERVDKERREILLEMPDIIDAIETLEQRYGGRVLLPNSEEEQYRLSKALNAFMQLVKRSSGMSNEEILRFMEEKHFDSPRTEVAKPYWDALVPVIQNLFARPDFDEMKSRMWGMWWPRQALEYLSSQ